MMNRKLASWMVVIGLLLPTMSWALPDTLMQTGLVFDDGRPIHGEVDVVVRFYAEPAGGDAFFEEVHRDVEFEEVGAVAVLLGGLREDWAHLLARAAPRCVELDDREPIASVKGGTEGRLVQRRDLHRGWCAARPDECAGHETQVGVR